MCKRGVRLEEDLHHRALIKASETGQATGREVISCEAGEMCQRDNAEWCQGAVIPNKQRLKKLNYIMLYVKVIIWRKHASRRVQRNKDFKNKITQ